MSSNVQVVILAAGQGKRMGASIPKPLVPVLGKPMIRHLIETLKGVTEMKPVVVVSPAGKPLFEAALGNAAEYVIQDPPQGTGDAVRAAQPACTAGGIMVLYGDHPFLPERVLNELVAMHDAHPDALVMLTATVPSYEGPYANFMSWGRILRDAEGNVTGIRESKDQSDEEKKICEVNPGMYVFPSAWLWNALSRLKNTNASSEYYVVDLLLIAREDGVEIVTASTDALDVLGINTPEELKRAEEIKQAHQ